MYGGGAGKIPFDFGTGRVQPADWGQQITQQPPAAAESQFNIGTVEPTRARPSHGFSTSSRGGSMSNVLAGSAAEEGEGESREWAPHRAWAMRNWSEYSVTDNNRITSYSTSGFAGHEVSVFLDKSSKLFEKAQELHRKSTSNHPPMYEVTEISQEQRQALEDCIRAIQAKSDAYLAIEDQSAELNEIKRNTAYFLESLGMVSSICHLVEVVFFDPSAFPALSILHWICNEVDSDSREIIKTGEQWLTEERFPHQSDRFWSLIKRQLLRGDNISAAKNLSLHTEKMKKDRSADTLQKAYIHMCEELIQKIKNMPVQVCKGDAPPREVHQLRAAWRKWSYECEQLANKLQNEQQHPLIKELLIVAKILAGDEKAIEKSSMRWGEQLGGKILYIKPDCKLAELRPYIRKCNETQFPECGSDLSTAFTTMLSKIILNMDVGQLVKQILEIGSDACYVALQTLMVSLLTTAKALTEDMLPKSDVPLLEFLKFEAAEKSMSTVPNGSWIIAARWCEGDPHMLSSLITRLSPESESVYRELVQWARAYGLGHEADKLCKIRAKKWLSKQKQNYGTAALWMVRGQDMQTLGRLCSNVIMDIKKAVEESPLLGMNGNEDVNMDEPFKSLRLALEPVYGIMLAALGDETLPCIELKYLHIYAELIEDLIKSLDDAPAARKRAGKHIETLISKEYNSPSPSMIWPHIIQLSRLLLTLQRHESTPPLSVTCIQRLTECAYILECSTHINTEKELMLALSIGLRDSLVAQNANLAKKKKVPRESSAEQERSSRDRSFGERFYAESSSRKFSDRSPMDLSASDLLDPWVDAYEFE